MYLFQIGKKNLRFLSRLCAKLGFGPKNGQIWPKICIFGYFGPNIGLSDPFDAMSDQKKQCESKSLKFIKSLKGGNAV